ncbi:hypothetical protein ACWGNA_20915 [Brucella cytisi]|uniref:hypothetical protein n=1 Tax=Brucella cytisi TaxID=407152 RepID=UPI0035D8F930
MNFYALIATLTIHVLAGVFWAGSTSAMANLGNENAGRLFPFQMGSAVLTILTGVGLWWFQLASDFGAHEQVLLLGILAAVIALAVQLLFVGGVRGALAAAPEIEKPAIVSTMTRGNRAAAGFLMIAVAAMVISRFY